MTTVTSTDNQKPTSDAVAREDVAWTKPRLVIRLEGSLDDLLKALPQVLKQLGKGGKRGPKLSAEIAAMIRRRVAAGAPKEVLAKEFGVTVMTVENILAGRTYPESAEQTPAGRPTLCNPVTGA